MREIIELRFKGDLLAGDIRWRKIDFILIHVLLLCTGYFISRQFGLLDFIPLREKLLQWDTGWYNEIRRFGYEFSATEQSSSGFFPLFPYLWKWSGLGVIGITVFNIVVSILSLVLLFRNFNFGKAEFLTIISFPSMFFLFVPYTESLYFFFCTLFLVGLKRDNTALILTGLFCASLTRSTGLFFLPALILTALLTINDTSLSARRLITQLLIWIAPVILGLMVVIIWQYWETGIWLAYFKAQSIHWLRGFSFPSLPLSTWNYTKILWLDGLAFLIGFFALLIVILKLIRRLRGKLFEAREMIFSEAYLAVIFFILLLFNPKNAESGLTEISGANRYIFVSPFFFLFMRDYLNTLYKPSWIIFMIIPLFWLLFDIYDGAAPLAFGFTSLYVFLFLSIQRINNRKPVYAAVYVINLVLQFYIIDLFIRGEWVG